MCSISPTVQGHNKNEDVISNGLFRHVLEGLEAKSRMSSTSSTSSSDSQTPNTNARDTPTVRSDSGGTGALNRRAAAPETEKSRSQTPPTPS